MRNTLISIFDGIKDPRKIDRCVYELGDLLDATFKEDDCSAKMKNAAQNLSLLRKLALQVTKATNDRLSLRKRLVKASMDKHY